MRRFVPQRILFPVWEWKRNFSNLTFILLALFTLEVRLLADEKPDNLVKNEASNSTRTSSISKTTVFEAGEEGYRGYRIPAIVRAINNDLLAFCEARDGGDASEIDLVMKRSSDGGKSWGTLQVVMRHTDFIELFDGPVPPITVGNPAPVVDQLDPQHPGRIWLPFTLENDRVFVTYSDDHGVTWADRREITADVKLSTWGWYATGPVHSIQLQHGEHRGRLVVPADHRLGVAGEDKGPNGAQLLFSDDHGQSWKLGAVDDSYDDGLNANETTVVELNDGRLFINTRDQNGAAPGNRGSAISLDGGTSFVIRGGSAYQAFVPDAEPLDAPVVQCSLLRVFSTQSGDASDLILFCGPDEDGPSGPGRSDLRLRMTTDETATWTDGPLIHEGPAAYSDMLVIKPGLVGILYEGGPIGGSPYATIQFATIKLTPPSQT